MMSRVLSLVALAGMLAASGCNGGGTGSGSASGITPAAPAGGSTTGTARGTASITASFEIPVAQLKGAGASAARRNPQYLSPGTTGLSVLLGDGSVIASGAGLSGTAQLTGQVLESGAGGQNATVSFLSASNSAQPVQGQTLTITHVINNGDPNTPLNTTSYQFTITQPPAANGTILTGTFAATTGATPTAVAPWKFVAGDLVTFTPTGPNSTGQQFIIGNQNTGAALTPTPVVNAPIPSTIYGATTSSTVSYSFASDITAAPNSLSGYYIFTITINGLTAGDNYTLGIVTTDLFNKNFVLSEAQHVIATPAAGGLAIAAFTLKSVIAGVYEPAPTLVQALPLGSTAAAPRATPGTYETTLFATDELGYTVTDDTAFSNTLPANANTTSPLITIVPTTSATALSYRGYNYDFTPLTTTTPLTLVPTTANSNSINNSIAPNQFTLGYQPAAVDASPAVGVYFYRILTSIPNAGPVAIPSSNTTADGPLAGSPINIICGVPTAGVTSTATLASTAITPVVGGTDVVGYTFTPGTNTPNATTVINLPTVDCTPGIGAVIN